MIYKKRRLKKIAKRIGVDVSLFWDYCRELKARRKLAGLSRKDCRRLIALELQS